jgi:(1->4)-alpha-D-glucan 1-alpha-D-glucosylmutase
VNRIERKAEHRGAPPEAPVATYRLQFHSELTFDKAAEIVDYLDRLGVSHVYASPIFEARPGSAHGYDVLDHGSLRDELGGEAGLERLAERLKSRGMGLVLDVVPNHMCVACPGNRWWSDVLENGPSSPFARYFDLDWKPPKTDLEDKVLLPILGEQYGRVLENQEIRIERSGGAFFVVHGETRLPLAPKSWSDVLQPVLGQIRGAFGELRAVRELSSILTAIAHLPERSETATLRIEERQREKEIVKERLAALAEAFPEVGAAIDDALAELNGRRGDPRSFDRLESLLARQAYRLSFWRVASDEINYRRFFDVNALAAIRIEEPEVFEAVQSLPFRLLEAGAVAGLRVDHVDGLFDPVDYLQRVVGRGYLVVEKVLVGGERLRPDWPVDGTTGYDFLNLLNGIFVEPRSGPPFRDLYARFIGVRLRFFEVLLSSKRLVLDTSMSSELTVLARKLDRISEQHRFSRDFTLKSLQDALGEVIACFPVYRSYVRASRGDIDSEDRGHILAALRRARLENPATSGSLFDFIGSVLLLEDPPSLDEPQRAERRDFVMRFQQLTGPVMAKGLEDTALYRYHPLASLNEVGGDPDAFGLSIETFHRENQERLREWPRALSATTTHDTKRDEDVRSRINVLSEIPDRWERAVRRWRELNRRLKAPCDEGEVPDANEEYLLYQTLVGAWPVESLAGAIAPGFVPRVEEYLRKALREAKRHTSWIDPNEGYERAATEFVEAILDPASNPEFLSDFITFVSAILQPGLLNSISQTVLKIAAPGIPDFYQGTELWEFNLVDPDNRRPVDWERRREALGMLDEPSALPSDRPLAGLESGLLKLHVTERALALRRALRRVFDEGDYVPLYAAGPRARHVVAFARKNAEGAVIAVVGRFFATLPVPAVGATAWETTSLGLDAELSGSYREVFTGRELAAEARERGRSLPLAEVFSHLPAALLERTS